MAGKLTAGSERRRELELDVEVMRKRGVVSWNGIVLGPEPRATKIEKGEPDPLRHRREHYEELLGRSVTDAELARLP